jgi:hypothetical protein
MLFFGMEANMNATFSFLISVGIIAFGIWIVAGTIAAGTIAAGSPLAWALMGLLTTIVGSISLYEATRDLKIA